MVIISPSILSADFANLERDIKKVEDAGADWLHVDVMDGHFVPNITIGVPVVASIKKVTKLPLDVHLMIENPEKYVEQFVKAGADIITFHYEAIVGQLAPTLPSHVGRVSEKQEGVRLVENLENDINHSNVNSLTSCPLALQTSINQIISKIHSYGVKVGMSIKPKTSAEVVLPYLKDLDMVLVMTVEPGFGGQKFMEDCAKKVEYIRRKSNDIIIQVDGGINAETARICTSYGANSLVAGNYIYKSENIAKAIKSLR